MSHTVTGGRVVKPTLRDFVDANLKGLAQELLHWQLKGRLPDPSPLFDKGVKLVPKAHHDPHQMVEREVAFAALKLAAK